MPQLQISSKSASTNLRPVVDNSKEKYFRPIFLQKDPSCGQASGVGYTFTYEINRVRGLPANDTSYKENLYPTHYTWNYLNRSAEYGSFYFDGWSIIRDSGCPNYNTYGGMWLPGSNAIRKTGWKTGYDFYLATLRNRVVLDYYPIKFKDDPYEGLDRLKHWINDHGDGSEIGGLACFQAYFLDSTLSGTLINVPYGDLPSGNDTLTGKKIVLRW